MASIKNKNRIVLLKDFEGNGDMNIYFLMMSCHKRLSFALSIERMKRMTGGESCVEEGDYLAWADMEWSGQARKETVDTEEPCKGEPYVDLYYTRFPGWDACIMYAPLSEFGHKSSFSDFSSRLVHTSTFVEDEPL